MSASEPSVGDAVLVFLYDGRVIDVSGLTSTEAIEKLRAAGVKRPSEIRRTEHRIARAESSR